MTDKKQIAARKSSALFGKENYKWMIIGLIVIIAGLLLMAGGKSEDPNQFDPNQVYSFRRITLAPILILIGLGLEVFAIFRRPDRNNNGPAH
ncbi:MAG TPA: DUF3098 domain-containing protein [Chitinophagaceae bacterium]